MKSKLELYKSLPLIPLREVIVFPSTFVPFLVGRYSSLSALKYAEKRGEKIFLATQINPSIDLPKPEDIYTVGVEAKIVQTADGEEGNKKLIVEGTNRYRIIEYEKFYPFYRVLVKELPKVSQDSETFDKHYKILINLFKNFLQMTSGSKLESVIPAISSTDSLKIVDIISSQIPVPVYEKQNILETINPLSRIIRLNFLLRQEIRNRGYKKSSKKSRSSFSKSGLGEYDKKRDSGMSEIEELKDKITKKKMPDKVKDKANKEVEKLEMMPPMSAEATVTRNYLDWILEIPWEDKTDEKEDITEAEKILEEDHYGLQKPKKRILEFLAVRRLTKENKSPIICFIGPPGVGKSSLGKSVARATNRKFVRFSLGGVRDEADIKGHRRTYIGSYPGQIIQQIARSKVKNPVFLLDEIDKMTADFRGDPAAALLEVLDPEQNKEFVDRYLDLEFDLSDVLFITTGNSARPIPSALKDRMEIIEITGYTELEKLNIAKKYLIKKELQQNGIKPENAKFTDGALKEIIRYYTRESGVRNLQREIGNICRKISLEVVKDENFSTTINKKDIRKKLGPRKYRLTRKEKKADIGFATGLSWTEVGGDLLTFEVRKVPGKGKLFLTGRLGEVMKESAQTAFSYVKSKLLKMNFDFDKIKDYDFHLHVPEGAVPKEGPSAGVTIAIALISLILEIPVKNDIAMTGEVTLRGKVLPIGGLKEKLIAAHREKVNSVIIPYENQPKLEEVPKEVKEKIKLYKVKSMDEVLEIALEENINEQSYKHSVSTSLQKEN